MQGFIGMGLGNDTIRVGKGMRGIVNRGKTYYSVETTITIIYHHFDNNKVAICGDSDNPQPHFFIC